MGVSLVSGAGNRRNRRTRQVEVEEALCARCKAWVPSWRDMQCSGEVVALGVSCGCFGDWLQQREFWEYEVTGVVR